MRVLVVVQGELGAAIMRRVLPSHSGEVRVRGKENHSAIDSAAFWAVRDHRCRVVVVADALSTDRTIADWVEVSFEDVLMFRDAVTIHVAIPESAIVLFESPEHLSEILGVEITPEERVRAEYVPRQVVDVLIRRSPRVHSYDELAEAISDEYASHIRAHPLMRQVECSATRALAAEPLSAGRPDWFREGRELLPT